MRSLTSVMVIISIVVISGCGARGFVRDGATYDEFNKEIYQCTQETRSLLGCTFGCSGRMKLEEQNRRNQCMKAHGWRISREEGRFMP